MPDVGLPLLLCVGSGCSGEHGVCGMNDLRCGGDVVMEGVTQPYMLNYS